MFPGLFLKPALCLSISPQEQSCSLTKSPALIRVTDPGTSSAMDLARRLPLTFDQATIGNEVLHARETVNVMEFVQYDQ